MRNKWIFQCFLVSNSNMYLFWWKFEQFGLPLHGANLSSDLSSLICYSTTNVMSGLTYRGSTIILGEPVVFILAHKDKNSNWQEANQLAFYKCDWRVELGQQVADNNCHCSYCWPVCSWYHPGPCWLMTTKDVTSAAIYTLLLQANSLKSICIVFFYWHGHLVNWLQAKNTKEKARNCKQILCLFLLNISNHFLLADLYIQNTFNLSSASTDIRCTYFPTAF